MSRSFLLLLFAIAVAGAASACSVDADEQGSSLAQSQSAIEQSKDEVTFGSVDEIDEFMKTNQCDDKHETNACGAGETAQSLHACMSKGTEACGDVDTPIEEDVVQDFASRMGLCRCWQVLDEVNGQNTWHWKCCCHIHLSTTANTDWVSACSE